VTRFRSTRRRTKRRRSRSCSARDASASATFSLAPLDAVPRVEIHRVGRTDTFTFDLANGKYAVTVSIGWYGKTYSKQRVVVEGTVLFDNAETNPTTPYLVQTVEVDVADGNVTLEVGQTNEYTMLNYVSIEPR
jgi:hypothetical protein